MRARVLGAAIALAVIVSAGQVEAGFGQWTIDVKDDPFDSKGKLFVSYMDSVNTGVVIMCDEDSEKLVIRWATPFQYDQAAPPSGPIPMGVIVDKFESHLGFASVQMLGTGNIGFDFERTSESARRFLQEMRDGTSKLYIKIGEADPQEFRLRGSTKAAERALDYCF